MKTKNLFLVPALIAALSLLPAGRVTAQAFTTLHSFTPVYPNPTVQAYTNSDGAYPAAGILTNNTLYGTAVSGGSGANGAVFAVNTDGTGFTNLYSFNNNLRSDGAHPAAGLILSGNTLYGTTGSGGSAINGGTVFAVNADGTGFATLHRFYHYYDGDGPHGELILSGNTLYGTAQDGGSGGDGTVFALNTNGTGFSTLHSFSRYVDGAFPDGGLVLLGNTLYGTAGGEGGSYGNGTVFAVNTDGTGFTTLHSFIGYYDGVGPVAGLTGSGNTLYGTASYGGAGSSGSGTVFSLSLPPPVARCKNVTVSAEVSCSADASIDDGSFDPNGGKPFTLVQSPAGPYPLGETSVTLTVTDNHGASNSCVATVTVVDTTPPVITCPGNTVTDATSPAGAVVSFAPAASDNCSVASVTSSPASGSMFAIGDTTVTCTATDGAGNHAACAFTVHVNGAAEQINGLIALVQSLGLQPGTANSLVVKLQGAASALDRGNLEAACGNLGAVLNEANAQTGKQLSFAQAGLLNAEATRIRAVLGCN